MSEGTKVTIYAAPKMLQDMIEDLYDTIAAGGNELEPFNGGMDIEHATLIPPGPDEQIKWAKAAPGWYDLGNGPEQAVEGRNWLVWWNKFSWILKDMGPLPIQEGTNEIIEGGVDLVNQDGVFKAVEKVNNKVASIVEESLKLNPVFVPTSTATIFYESSTFSGWATFYGVFKNFNFVRVFYKNLDFLSLPSVSLMNYRICENDEHGNVLASGQIEVNFSSGESGYIGVQLNQLIENPNNANIWFEFWGNGNMAYYQTAETVPTRNLKYKTTEMPFNENFSQKSSNTSASFTKVPDVKFYFNEGEFSPTGDFSTEVVQIGEAKNEVSFTNTNPVSGSGVKEAITPFEDIIELDFVKYSSDIVGEKNVLTEYSTFSGWGQLKGVKSGFNAIGFPFRPYDENNLPTYCTLTIRNGSNTGEILFQKRIDGSFEKNKTYDLIFQLGYVFKNPNNYNLFVQYHSDGYFSCIGTGSGQTSPLYYIVAKNNQNLVQTTTNQNILRTEFLLGTHKGVFTEGAQEQILEFVGNPSTQYVPNVLLPSKVWLYPGFEYNMFSKNLVVPDFGFDLNNYQIDFNGSKGVQNLRGYRLNPIEPNLNNAISVNVFEKGSLKVTKSQTLYSVTLDFGNGVIRKVLVIGDSTVNGSRITTPLKATFDADVMNIEFLGTLGAAGVKHEGRGGWTVNDYYGIGRVLYVANVEGLATSPSNGSIYTQGGINYSTTEVNITGGTGYFSLNQVSGSARPLSPTGTLTKVSGNGPDVISYTSSSTTSTNPFYNPSTQEFDIQHYLTTTGQSLSDFDWIFFQLGINDMFGLTDLVSAEAKATTMVTQLKEMIANIHSYNPNIRVGVVVTFPPADQSAFGANYSLGQTTELYTKTGLLTWQKKLIQEFDNSASINSKIYLVSAHLNLDTEFNYPSSNVKPNARYTGNLTVNMQSNGVHPSADGDYQIADMYAGLIKYFG